MCAVAGVLLSGSRRVDDPGGIAMVMQTLGVDLGIRAGHVATLCDERGEVVWSKRRFGNRHDELEALVDQVGECDEVTVVMEPTRNAWVPVAAHLMAVGARVVLVAPERSPDLRRSYAKHTDNDDGWSCRATRLQRRVALVLQGATGRWR
jgi:transposase